MDLVERLSSKNCTRGTRGLIRGRICDRHQEPIRFEMEGRTSNDFPSRANAQLDEILRYVRRAFGVQVEHDIAMRRLY